MLEDWSCIRVFTCHVWEQGVVGGTIWWQICRLTLIDTNWQISCCLAKTKVQMALLTSHTSPWLLEACMGRGILTIKHWKVFQTKLGVDPPPPSGNARVLKAPVTEGSALEMKLFCRSQFLSDPGIPGPLYGSKSLKQTDLCADLTDVTLADEDTNSILTDDVNMATISNVAMQVAPSGGQNWNQCKWRYLVAKSVTNAGGATWWCKKQQYIQATQVAPQGGQIYNQCTWCHLMAKIGTNTSYTT